MRNTHGRRASWAGLCLATALFAGCGADDETKVASGDAGGSSGNGGGGARNFMTGQNGGTNAGGTAGAPNGGAGASAGSAGTGGRGDAGAAGSAGSSAGDGGTTGDGGAVGSGGAAGSGGIALPTIIEQPRSTTVVESRGFGFVVDASGADIGYQWQRASNADFLDLVGAHTALLSFQTSTLADDGARFRVRVSNGAGTVTSDAARLRVLPLAEAAYVELDAGDGQFQEEHPLTASMFSDLHAVQVDLVAGRLGSSTTFRDGEWEATARLVVRLYNDADTSVRLPAGSIRAHVEGTYAPWLSSVMELGASGILIATPQADLGLQYFAGAFHTVSYVDDDGEPVARSHTLMQNTNGGEVAVTTETAAALSFDLIISSEIELSAAESLELVFWLTTSASGGTTDFNSTPASLSVTLPPGVVLSDNALQPLHWVGAN